MASEAWLFTARTMAGQLQAYWQWARSNAGQAAIGSSQHDENFANANESMVWLADHAEIDEGVRSVLAQSGIVEACLLNERAGATDFLASTWCKSSSSKCQHPQGEGVGYALNLDFPEDIKPPRLLLLEAIHRFGFGTTWRDPNPEGITTWLHSASESAIDIDSVIADTLENDMPAVQLTLLGILAGCAVPASFSTPAISGIGGDLQPSEILQAVGSLK